MEKHDILQTDKVIPNVPISQTVTYEAVPYPLEKLEEYAKITRDMISWEALRMNERSSWLLQLQGLLFTALAFAWDKNRPLIYVLVGVGICSSCIIGKALVAAVKACATIEDEWRLRGQGYEGPWVSGSRRTKSWTL